MSFTSLLDDAYWPVTSAIGFVNAPLERVAEVNERWRRDLYGDAVRVVRASEGFPAVLNRLEPLTQGAYPREVWVAAGEWSAYFDCARGGTDARPPTSVISQRLGVRSVVVTLERHEWGKANPRGRLGSVQFALYRPGEPSERLVRYVAAHFESRWEWHEWGEVLPFEETEQYGARRVRDRLTSEMVGRYCRALGIDLFDPGFYGPEAVFFDTGRPPRLETTIAQVQAERGVVPGRPRVPVE
ncbi:hypothetical protein [Microbacterium album]|uniref:Uncharacterized protein n=1 Tax=Microbacterium album TaxID=2053191 RepID=A0A917IID6_9MICO|nr:hypothetical protein [Microbacterium album]GGH51026.1 hypothetical protein GCM10010921_30200 [Microbacterium album]